MKTIWKFKLEQETELDMPAGAEVLCVRGQGDGIFLWALVNPENLKEKRCFVSLGTGHDVLDIPLKFVGTAFLEHGPLVIHIFERVAPDLVN